MVTGTRFQNGIVVLTIIAALLGSFSLVFSTGYYTGSYVMVTYLDVRLDSVTLGNFDPENFDPANDSIEPSIGLIFRLVIPEGVYGKASVTYLTSSATLNGESFDYISLLSSIPEETGSFYSGYNRTLTLRARIGETADRMLLWNATQTDTWVFLIGLTMFYKTFESRAPGIRQFVFVHEGYTQV
jgi:hypothetical protein